MLSALRWSLWVLVVCSALLLPTPAVSAEKIRLASLEWPPYTGAGLPQGGTATATVVSALRAAGYEVEVDFLPWERTLALAQSPSSGYAGYFPEYYADSIATQFLFSVPIGSGPLGLVQHRDQPLHWQQLTDLQGLTIGVVQGYVNTPDFDAAVAAGQQPVEAVSSDQQNLRKVAAKRIPAAIIDRNVMNYWLAHDPLLEQIRSRLQFHDTLLEEKQLYVCFRKGRQGEVLAAALAKALAAAATANSP